MKTLFEKFIKKLPEQELALVAKDLLRVLVFVYLFFSLMEARNPSSISAHFDHHVLLYFIAIIAFVFLAQKGSKRIEALFYLCALAIILEYFSRLIYYGYLPNSPLPNLLLSDHLLNCFFLLIILSFLKIVHQNSKNTELKGVPQTRFLTKKNTAYILALITLAAFSIRIWKLGELSPVRDEFSHLVAAKRFLQEGFFNYQRTEILTYLVAGSWKLFSGGLPSVFFARLVSAIIGTICVPVLYLLMRTFSKRNTALVASFLLATSPFHVGMSRYTREYVLFFLLLLIGIYLANKLFRAIFFEKKLEILALGVAISPIFLYYFFVRNSTYPFTFVILSLYIFSYLFAFLWQKKPVLIAWYKSYDNQSRKKLFYFFSIVSAIPLFFAIKRFVFGNVHFKINKFNDDWFDILFGTSSAQQWFYNSIFPTHFIFAIFVLGIIFGYKKRQLVASAITFLVMFFAYSFFLDISTAPRYIFSLLAFEVIIFSYSIIFIFYAIKPKNWPEKMIATGLLVCVFNPLTTIFLTKSEKDGEVSKQQGLIHRNTKELIEFLDARGFVNGDSVISPNKAIFVYYYNYPFITDPVDWPYLNYKYNKDGTLFSDYGKVLEAGDKQSILKYANDFESGWIIIDVDRNRNWDDLLEPADFISAGKQINYLGNVGGTNRGYDVYKWN